MPIPEETIQQILSSTDIVELIGDYFPLQRKGQDFWAVCPFHSEKSPSFKVSPTRQAFYCFGCNAKGNAIGFVMSYENLDFPSAVKRLASRVGITIREEAEDPRAREESKLRKTLLEIHKEAAFWFHDYLLKSRSLDANNARDYLKQRNLGLESTKRWGIGFAPTNGNEFANWARGRGYSGTHMKASGLMSQREEGNSSKGLYTRFRDRIMFPINNDFGETIAFSGRILDSNSKIAKYVNSPETLLFKKSNIFFGLDKSKRAIAKAQAVIICEGQLDMIRCYENGIENVVAPLGTSLTENQSRTLRRFTGERGEALLCFDSDAAGYKAAVRAYKELTSTGIFVRAIQLPPNQDPDSLITEAGPEAFTSRVVEARPFHQFQIDELSKSLDMHDARDRVLFANEIAVSISIINDPVAREGMINDVATRLGISADDFRKRVATAVKKDWRNISTDAQQANEQGIEITDPNIRILIKMALTDNLTQQWMLETQDEYIPFLESNSEAIILTKIWKKPPTSTAPEEINSYISTIDEISQTILTEILMQRSAKMNIEDSKRAIMRLRIKDLERKRDTNKTKATLPNLTKDQILQLTGKVESQRKELLDFKIALKNIAPSQD